MDSPSASARQGILAFIAFRTAEADAESGAGQVPQKKGLLWGVITRVLTWEVNY